MTHKRLKAWCEERGLSAADLARLVNVSRAAASRWCRGLRRPKPAERARIAKVTKGAIAVDAWLTAAEKKRESFLKGAA